MKTKLLQLLIFLFVSFNVNAQYIIHPWQNKTVAYFGDSITDPNNMAANHKFWNFLQDWLGINPYVYAVSGREWNDIPHQTDQLKQQHGDNVDAIIIFIGTNDYNNAVPLGQWFYEKAEPIEYGLGYDKRPEIRKKRVPAMDPDTYCGRINIALDSLKRTYPTKQIVLLTPIHRSGYYLSNRNWQIPEDYANRCGEFLDAYVDAVIEAGKIWSIPVIDLNQLCGLYPLHGEHAQYFADPETDLLHPNNAGHERIARTLYYQLLTLPCNF